MQQSLNFGTEPRKIIRRHAPVTSIEAGKSVDTTGMERTIFELIQKQDQERGLTAKEAARILNKELNQISGRFTGLKIKALIELVIYLAYLKRPRNRMSSPVPPILM